MASAGVAWGVYSLRGRGSTDPLANTGRNFLLATLPAMAFWVMRFAVQGSLHFTAPGIGLAVASGALASGLGYSIWYTALPLLTATRAAIVQLSVPVLAAVGGVLLLGEHITVRLLGAGSALLCGVLLALTARSRKPAAVAGEQ